MVISTTLRRLFRQSCARRNFIPVLLKHFRPVAARKDEPLANCMGFVNIIASPCELTLLNRTMLKHLVVDCKIEVCIGKIYTPIPGVPNIACRQRSREPQRHAQLRVAVQHVTYLYLHFTVFGVFLSIGRGPRAYVLRVKRIY
jgi:hypothetical protein